MGLGSRYRMDRFKPNGLIDTEWIDSEWIDAEWIDTKRKIQLNYFDTL